MRASSWWGPCYSRRRCVNCFEYSRWRPASAGPGPPKGALSQFEFQTASRRIPYTTPAIPAITVTAPMVLARMVSPFSADVEPYHAAKPAQKISIPMNVTTTAASAIWLEDERHRQHGDDGHGQHHRGPCVLALFDGAQLLADFEQCHKLTALGDVRGFCVMDEAPPRPGGATRRR